MKWPQPPSLHTMCIFHGVAGVGFAGMAIIADNRWLALFDALASGFQFGFVVVDINMIMMRRLFDKMHENFAAMVQLNKGLIDGKVEIIIAQIHDRDDDAPVAPRPH